MNPIQTIKASDKEMDLGVTTDSEISFDPHIERVK